MYRILTLLFFVTISEFTFSQIDAQPDSFMVVTKFVFPVINGIPSGEQVAISQNTYNRNKQLIRKISYSVNNKGPEIITYYHYKDDKLVFREHINIENQLVAYAKLTYKKGLISSMDSMRIGNDDSRYRIKYKSKKNVVTEKHNKNGSNFKQVKTTYVDNKITSIKEVFKKSSGINQSELIFQYDDEKKIIKKIKTTENTNGLTETLINIYNYKNKQLKEVVTSNEKEIIKKAEYNFNQFGDLESINTKDGNNTYISSYLLKYNYTDLIIPNRIIPTVPVK